MSRIHVVHDEIQFKHCDPAGIVFFPRFVEMVNDTVEHWFQHGLGVSFAELHMVRRMGIPCAALNCEFKSPGRLGERIIRELRVQKVGRSSLGMRIEIKSAETPHELKMAADMTVVFVDLDGIRSVEIPADIRARLEVE